MTQLDMFGYVAPVKVDAKAKAKKVVILTGKLEWKWTKRKGFVGPKKAQSTLAM